MSKYPTLFFYTVNMYNKPERLQVAKLIDVNYTAVLPYVIRSIEHDLDYYVSEDGDVWSCLDDTASSVPHAYVGRVEMKSLNIALSQRRGDTPFHDDYENEKLRKLPKFAI